MSGEVHPRLPCGHVICFGSVLTGNSSRNVNLRGAGFHSLAVCPWTKVFPFLDYIYSIYKVRRETSSEVLDLKVSKSVSGGREVGCVCVFVYMCVCVCVHACICIFQKAGIRSTKWFVMQEKSRTLGFDDLPVPDEIIAIALIPSETKAQRREAACAHYTSTA